MAIIGGRFVTGEELQALRRVAPPAKHITYMGVVGAQPPSLAPAPAPTKPTEPKYTAYEDPVAQQSVLLPHPMTEAEIQARAEKIWEREGLLLREPITPLTEAREYLESGVSPPSPFEPLIKGEPLPVKFVPTGEPSITTTGLPTVGMRTLTLKETPAEKVLRSLPRAEPSPIVTTEQLRGVPEVREIPRTYTLLGLGEFKPYAPPTPEPKAVPWTVAEQYRVWGKELVPPKPEPFAFGLVEKVSAAFPSEEVKFFGQVPLAFIGGVAVGAAAFIEAPFHFVRDPIGTVRAIPRAAATTVHRVLTPSEIPKVSGEVVGSWSFSTVSSIQYFIC